MANVQIQCEACQDCLALLSRAYLPGHLSSFVFLKSSIATYRNFFVGCACPQSRRGGPGDRPFPCRCDQWTRTPTTDRPRAIWSEKNLLWHVIIHIVERSLSDNTRRDATQGASSGCADFHCQAVPQSCHPANQKGQCCGCCGAMHQ